MDVYCSYITTEKYVDKKKTFAHISDVGICIKMTLRFEALQNLSPV